MSGATAQNIGQVPYTNTSQYLHALRSRIDVAILQLGTNDAKVDYWNESRYVEDYLFIIRNVQNLITKPRVLISIPPPLYKSPKKYEMRQDIINERLPLLIRQIGRIAGVEVINLFDPLGGSSLTRSDAFADGCHPNDVGYHLIANTVGCALLRRGPRNFINPWSTFMCME